MKNIVPGKFPGAFLLSKNKAAFAKRQMQQNL